MRILSIRRKGSAAPQSNWSPTVNAPRYSLPMLSLRRRPTGTRQSASYSNRSQDQSLIASRVFGTNFRPVVGTCDDTLRFHPVEHLYEVLSQCL